jgi:hypothetical protein
MLAISATSRTPSAGLLTVSIFPVFKELQMVYKIYLETKIRMALNKMDRMAESL